jgi:hypothetical protein
VAGALVATGGLVWLSWLDATGSPWDVVAPLALAMVGVGASGLPLTMTATSGLGPGRSGLASGLLNTSRHVGAALGLAALVAVSTAAAAGQATGAAGTQGLGAGLLAGAGLLLAAALGGLALPGRDNPPHHDSRSE